MSDATTFETRVLESLTLLLRELIDGPQGRSAFVLNPGDAGLLGALDRLTAAEASARPNGRSSVAAHVDHVRFGFELFNRFRRGENPWAEASFSESWTRQVVGEDEWRARRAALATEARAWLEAVGTMREWARDADTELLSAAVGSIVHLAYHLGAIRQLAPTAQGPRASD